MNTSAETASPYLRLIIQPQGGAQRYQIDVEAQLVFSDYARRLIRELTQDCTIKSGETCLALIIPRYPPAQMRARPHIDFNLDKAWEAREWLTMELEEGLRPDAQIAFFTLEIRARERELIYRHDFSVQELSAFERRILTALAQAGAVVSGQTVSLGWYARQDPEAKFAAAPSASDLVKIEDAEPSALSEENFSEKDLTAYGLVEKQGVPSAAGGAQIVLARSALQAMQNIARGGATVEEGGVLVGNVFRQPRGAGYLIEIADHLYSEKARGTQFNLKYTFEAWQQRRREMKERFPQQRIVGWYHTHLVAQEYLDRDNRIYRTELFFSGADHFMHKEFFKEKWYVALVLNPAGEAAFFHWHENRVVRAAGFYVYQD